jgi:hypothetical protein
MIVDLSNKEVNNIVFNYYLKQYPNPRQAMAEYKKLNMLLDNKTCQLCRYGNIVFFLMLKNNEVEFHSMGQETSAFAFIRGIYKLIDYVKTLNVSAITTYGNDVVFEKLYERVLVQATKDFKVAPDGVAYSYYRLEF